MPITLDLTGLHQFWPGLTESLTYREQTAPGVYSDSAVSKALRNQPTTREREPTAGVYTGADASFIVPDVFLSPAPKPGDIVKDAANVSWTVVQIAFDHSDAVHTLYGVALGIAAALRDQITVERPAVTLDASGAPSYAYAPVAGYTNLPARVQIQAQTAAQELGIDGVSEEYDITVGQQLALLANDRVVWGTLTLDVRDYQRGVRITDLPLIRAYRQP